MTSYPVAHIVTLHHYYQSLVWMQLRAVIWCELWLAVKLTNRINKITVIHEIPFPHVNAHLWHHTPLTNHWWLTLNLCHVHNRHNYTKQKWMNKKERMNDRYSQICLWRVSCRWRVWDSFCLLKHKQTKWWSRNTSYISAFGKCFYKKCLSLYLKYAFYQLLFSLEIEHMTCCLSYRKAICINILSPWWIL